MCADRGGFLPATLTGRLPLFAVRHLPTVCGFPATDTGRVCACHWAVALLFVARHLPTVCGFPATDTGRACACHWAFALFLVARHLPIVCGFPATYTGRLPHPFDGSCVPGQQASGSRPLGSASRTRCRAPRRPSELHAMRQELPSHSRLPVCRPCDSALACRQYRLWCAWSASFGKPSPWQCLVHSMQSPMPSVRTSLPSRALLCADRVTRPLCDDGIGSSVPMYRPLCADRVRFPCHVNCASSHPTQTTRRLVSVVCFTRPLSTAASALVCRQSRLLYADRVRFPRH